MHPHEYPEDLLFPMAASDIWVNLPIICSLLSDFHKSRGRNVSEYETSILKAKLGYESAKIMPRKAKNEKTVDQTVQTPVRSSQARWLNVPLSEDALATLEASEYTLEDVGARLLSMASIGWDITIKRDSATNGYSCFGFADDPNNDVDRVGLSGWASNPTDAALVFVYKYFDVLGGVIPAGVPTTQRRFR